jgi:hypothetical protein
LSLAPDLKRRPPDDVRSVLEEFGIVHKMPFVGMAYNDRLSGAKWRFVSNLPHLVITSDTFSYA